jgi:hypothetical protein
MDAGVQRGRTSRARLRREKKGEGKVLMRQIYMLGGCVVLFACVNTVHILFYFVSQAEMSMRGSSISVL